jgi:hypothetical protein
MTDIGPYAVDGAVVSEISKGLMVLVGIGTGRRPALLIIALGGQQPLTLVDSADDTIADIGILANKMYADSSPLNASRVMLTFFIAV